MVRAHPTENIDVNHTQKTRLPHRNQRFSKDVATAGSKVTNTMTNVRANMALSLTKNNLQNKTPSQTCTQKRNCSWQSDVSTQPTKHIPRSIGTENACNQQAWIQRFLQQDHTVTVLQPQHNFIHQVTTAFAHTHMLSMFLPPRNRGKQVINMDEAHPSCQSEAQTKQMKKACAQGKHTMA